MISAENHTITAVLSDSLATTREALAEKIEELRNLIATELAAHMPESATEQIDLRKLADYLKFSKPGDEPGDDDGCDS